MTRSGRVAVALLKEASKAEAAGELGVKAIKLLARGARNVGHAGVTALEVGGAVGRGAARAAGVHEAVGTGLGMAATGLAGASAAKTTYEAGKNRVDEWRYRNGLLPSAYYS